MDFELGKSYHQLKIGEKASFTKTITETDVYLFAGISGDFNPMHVNEEFAKKTPFKTRIAHGALPQSLIAPVLGMKLPGLGTIAVEISCRFKAPVFFGDTITATARVVEKIEKKQWVRMALIWTNQHGKPIAEGEAVVIPPPEASQPLSGKEGNMNPETMYKFLGNICRKLNIVRQSNALVNNQRIQEKLPAGTVTKVSYNDPELINEEFLSLLAPEGSYDLSNAEQAYCVMMASTGNNIKAITAAGLDGGLKTTEHIVKTMDYAIMIRGNYLRAIPRISAAIKLLQEESLRDININKDYIQIKLLQNIVELEEQVSYDPKARTNYLKAIEMLGRTIGAFQENLVVTASDPAATLDAMLRMAKDAKGVYELEAD